ncbi:MAG: hypothetical protein IJI03_06595 [Rudaea sp.]|nr:hypothetical protein [Rudaea sp.]
MRAGRLDRGLINQLGINMNLRSFRIALCVAVAAGSSSLFASNGSENGPPGGRGAASASANVSTPSLPNAVPATQLSRAQIKLERATALADKLSAGTKSGGDEEKLRLELIGNLMRGGDAEFDAVRTASSLSEALSVSRGIGGPAILPASLGDAASDLVFVPVSPCRILDTRVAGGAIAALTTRDVDVTAVSNYSFQGGSSTDCGIGGAGSFAAVAINFVAITPSASGFLTAYPYGTTRPVASTLNYTAGAVVANLGIIKLDQGAAANELTIYSYAQTHVVADVTGYFVNPQATALQCSDTANTVVTIAAGSTADSAAPACPAGYTQTATNCESSSWDMPLVYSHNGSCSAKNNGASPASLRASRTCCRVPGR